MPQICRTIGEKKRSFLVPSTKVLPSPVILEFVQRVMVRLSRHCCRKSRALKRRCATVHWYLLVVETIRTRSSERGMSALARVFPQESGLALVDTQGQPRNYVLFCFCVTSGANKPLSLTRRQRGSSIRYRCREGAGGGRSCHESVRAPPSSLPNSASRSADWLRHAPETTTRCRVCPYDRNVSCDVPRVRRQLTMYT